MPKPGLWQNTKFRRLVYMLQMPVPHVIGHLECLWVGANQSGNPVVGNEADVEIAAEWTGEPGKLFASLRDCGGHGGIGFIEPSDIEGAWQIHDFEEHAPQYVKERFKKRKQRDKLKESKDCPYTVPGQSQDNPFPSLPFPSLPQKENARSEEGLTELISAWNDLPAGIAPRVMTKASKALMDGYKRVLKEPELRECFDDVPALMAAVRKATWCHGKGWFNLPWLFSRCKETKQWRARRILDGCYGTDPNEARRKKGHLPRRRPLEEKYT